MAIHNGDIFPPPEEAEKKTPASNFSQEELDLEMVVVSAGDFIKEVMCDLGIVLIVDYNEEFAYQDGDVFHPTTCWWLSNCVCRWSILKDESVGSQGIRRRGFE